MGIVNIIAIVLTACGIETFMAFEGVDIAKIAIVLTACGIETAKQKNKKVYFLYKIAIVLTACGIET